MEPFRRSSRHRGRDRRPRRGSVLAATATAAAAVNPFGTVMAKPDLSEQHGPVRARQRKSGPGSAFNENGGAPPERCTRRADLNSGNPNAKVLRAQRMSPGSWDCVVMLGWPS
jgi:hypothetical protein